MQMLKAPIHNILLIDDDKDDCDVFQQALLSVSDKFQLSCMHRCEEILATLLAFKPDLIFLDINLPRINGLDCLKEIQDNAKYARIPIVMYSSSENIKEISIAYGLGATLYFKKPTNFSELVSSLKAILDMAWETPDLIKLQYFRDGKYYPYHMES